MHASTHLLLYCTQLSLGLLLLMLPLLLRLPPLLVLPVLLKQHLPLQTRWGMMHGIHY